LPAEKDLRQLGGNATEGLPELGHVLHRVHSHADPDAEPCADVDALYCSDLRAHVDPHGLADRHPDDVDPYARADRQSYGTADGGTDDADPYARADPCTDDVDPYGHADVHALSCADVDAHSRADAHVRVC
jgi:hypothetical protein